MKKLTSMIEQRTLNKQDGRLTIGLDLGDRSSCYCVLDEAEDALLEHRVGLFRERVLRYWGQALQRRSQIRRYAWVRRLKLAAQWLPRPRVLHPWPLDRFAASHPR